MDGFIEQIQQRLDAISLLRHREERDRIERETLASTCREVAGWGPGSVVVPGWRPAGEDDAAVQLGWAFQGLAKAVGRCGMAGRLEELAAEEGDPARAFAFGLVSLAGREATREETERRVRDAWTRPTVWRDVAAWISTTALGR